MLYGGWFYSNLYTNACNDVHVVCCGNVYGFASQLVLNFMVVEEIIYLDLIQLHHKDAINSYWNENMLYWDTYCLPID